MDELILQKKPIWQYFSQTQKDLVLEGQYLMHEIVEDHAYHFKDYSFLIFPFAKTYEGFLKQLFKDVKFISHLDYISDHLRLGKLLSPHLEQKLGERSLYKKIAVNGSEGLARRIWQAWKLGRNEVFHYFPHNIKAVSFQEAEIIINELLATMEEAYGQLKIMRVKKKLSEYR
ncbi:MAG: hypothetical protein WC489_04315 [Patescibacteria group bacterium]